MRVKAYLWMISFVEYLAPVVVILTRSISLVLHFREFQQGRGCSLIIIGCWLSRVSYHHMILLQRSLVRIDLIQYMNQAEILKVLIDAYLF